MKKIENLVKMEKEDGLDFSNKFNDNGKSVEKCWDDSDMSILENFGYSLSKNNTRSYR